MVRACLLASLAAAASVFAGRVNVLMPSVPGAYLFEFHEGQDPSDFFRSVDDHGRIRINLNHTFFKGASVQMHGGESAHQDALRLARSPVVKRMTPVQAIPRPAPKFRSLMNSRTTSQLHHYRRRNAQNSILPRFPLANSTEMMAPAPAAASASAILSNAMSTASPEADTFSPHVMTQVDKLRAQGVLGQGVKLAMIDTGVDYMHPALGGGFGDGFLVSFGADLVGDVYDGLANSIPVPDSDPMDCEGHGTHVAGIVAAQDNLLGFTGGAPGVTLGMYKVFGCEGSVNDDVLIAAFSQAHEAGADIITASIGSLSGWPDQPLTALVSSIVDAGVPVTVANSNDGALGIFASSGPADGRNVVGIGSVDNVVVDTVLVLSNYSVDGGDPQQFGFVDGDDAFDWTNVSMPLFATSRNASVPDDACDPLPDGTPDLSGFIALVRGGSCEFTQKAQNVADKGAKRVMFYGVGHAPVPVDVKDGAPQIVAAGMVDATVGRSWVALLAAGSKVTLSIDVESSSQMMTSVPNSLTGGFMSNFSTWGPNYAGDVKPQFSAVGGDVLSTYPRSQGSYAVLEGTSMATPLAAAIYALVGSIRGTFDPKTLKNVLSATAKPLMFNVNGNVSDFEAPVAQQGSGLLQAFDAAYATTLLSVSSLAFNDTAHRVESCNFTISNTGDEEVTYNLTHIPSHSFYAFNPDDGLGPAVFPNEDVASHATLDLSKTEITLGGGEAATIQVRATEPADIASERLAVWSGRIAIDSSDGSSLTLPYQGISGSLRDHVVLDTEGAWMSKSTDPLFNPMVGNGTAFAIPSPGNAKGDSLLPALVFDMALGTPMLRVDIVPLTVAPAFSNTTLDRAKRPVYNNNNDGTQPVGQPFGFPLRWVPRGQLAVIWNGQLDSGNFISPGRYKIVGQALRINGDAANKADWDVSETDPFSISYS